MNMSISDYVSCTGTEKESVLH